MTTELFKVTTTVAVLHGCKDVAMNWFLYDRKTPVGRYAELIANYDPADEYRYYPQAVVDEMFADDEAQALLKYLNAHHREGSTHRIEVGKLPISMKCMGWCAIAVGGPQDFYRLSREGTWNLPFHVWGYYDLRQHEPTPGGELERNRALRSGTWFISNGLCIRASELSETEFQAMETAHRKQRKARNVLGRLNEVVTPQRKPVPGASADLPVKLHVVSNRDSDG